jgi:hypothetical protein
VVADDDGLVVAPRPIEVAPVQVGRRAPRQHVIGRPDARGKGVPFGVEASDALGAQHRVVHRRDRRTVGDPQRHVLERADAGHDPLLQRARGRRVEAVVDVGAAVAVGGPEVLRQPCQQRRAIVSEPAGAAIGHHVAVLVCGERPAAVHDAHRVAAVVPEQPAVRVLGHGDPVGAERMIAIAPAPRLDRQLDVEGPREQLADGAFVAGTIAADDDRRLADIEPADRRVGRPVEPRGLDEAAAGGELHRHFRPRNQRVAAHRARRRSDGEPRPRRHRSGSKDVVRSRDHGRDRRCA